MDQLQLIREMRERTALPLLKCKSYLIEAGWDSEKAIKLAWFHCMMKAVTWEPDYPTVK